MATPRSDPASADQIVFVPPRRLRQLVHVVGAGILLIISLIYTVDGFANLERGYYIHKWNRYLAGTELFVTLMAFDSALIVLFTVALIAFRRVLPTLTLSPAGLRHARLRSETIWTWDELGPFRLNAEWGRSPFWWNRRYTAYAFSAAREQTYDPDTDTAFWYADVKLPLNALAAGRCKADAELLVELLNEWRTRYRIGNVDSAQST